MTQIYKKIELNAISMKKIFVLLLIFPLLVFSQKIKTKKDKILLDEKEIGIIKESAIHALI